MATYRAVTRVFVDNAIREAGEIFDFDGPAGRGFEPVSAADVKKAAEAERKAEPRKFGMEQGIDEPGSGSLSKPHDVISPPPPPFPTAGPGRPAVARPSQPAQPPNAPSLDWSKADLVDHARKQHIAVSDAMTKEDILAAIKKG